MEPSPLPRGSLRDASREALLTSRFFQAAHRSEADRLPAARRVDLPARAGWVLLAPPPEVTTAADDDE